MRCENCKSTIRVINGLCVHCRLLGKDIADAKPRKFLQDKIHTLLPILGIICLFVLLGSKYDFPDIFWTRKLDPGIVAPQEPVQLLGEFKSWNYKGYLFRPLARYKVRARVLLKSNYWFSPASDLSPIDLTLGWGPMSDQRLLDQLSLSSCNRCYNWYSESNEINPDEINRHAANTHLIPKDALIEKALKRVSISDVVTLSGYLVEVARADGWHWTSSLSREDSGGGACELMWVEQVSVG